MMATAPARKIDVDQLFRDAELFLRLKQVRKQLILLHAEERDLVDQLNTQSMRKVQ